MCTAKCLNIPKILCPCSSNVFVRGPPLAYPCSRKQTVRLKRAQGEKLTDITWIRIHTSTIRNKALHNLSSIKLPVAGFADSLGFLITYVIQNKHITNHRNNAISFNNTLSLSFKV